MNNIYLIGDTHGDWSAFNTVLKQYSPQNDVVIVLGDFGFVWDRITVNYNLDRLAKRFKQDNNKLLFVDGNHENFDLLEKYPITRWKGGEVRRLRNNILHLTRGQVFTIFGKTFFTMGGGNSIDKASRATFISWWPQEDIRYTDLQMASKNLIQHNDTVDYVLTHAAPVRIKEQLGFKREYDSYNESQLQTLAAIIHFKHWYFGHYHIDLTFENYTCLYKTVVVITNNQKGDLWD